MNETTTSGITGMRIVGVPVTDQDRAVEFYVEQLGCEPRVDAPVEQLGGRWIEVAPPGATTTIALVPAREGVPSGVETGIRLTTGDAAALHQNLRERGVDVGELLRWEGIPPMFTLHDPDGNHLVVVE
ncbi:MAG: VOC family protein [Actinomycetota bacterium]|nr:VOC family protein [Actinomycetota bacterium]